MLLMSVASTLVLEVQGGSTDWFTVTFRHEQMWLFVAEDIFLEQNV